MEGEIGQPTEAGDPDERYRKATDHIKTRSGDDLRIVFQYTPDSIDITYLDEELLGDDLLPRLRRLQTRALEMAAETARTANTGHGEAETILAAHEDVIIIYLLDSEDEGVIAIHKRQEGLFEGYFL